MLYLAQMYLKAVYSIEAEKVLLAQVGVDKVADMVELDHHLHNLHKQNWNLNGITRVFVLPFVNTKNLIVRVLHLFLRHSLNSLFQFWGRPSLRTLE